jgi:hypothetical protein
LQRRSLFYCLSTAIALVPRSQNSQTAVHASSAHFFAVSGKARNGKQRPLAETYVDACIERGAAMLRTHSSQRLVALIAVVVASATLLVAATAPSSRNAMINALGSSDPNPALGDEAKTFDRLVGTWDADFSFPRQDGSVLRKKGELRFGWVMDGTAIQDLWIGYPAEAGKERSVGTTLRFFDGQSKQWRIVFINPRFNYVVTAQGRRDGEDIVFHGKDTDGLPLRWTFSEITAHSFHWQGEKSLDGGKTWRVEEDHRMKRRT